MSMSDSGEHLGLVGTRGDDCHEIHSFAVNTETGELTRMTTSDVGPNPAYLALHPEEDIVYAVNQVPEGQITALELDRASGELEVINRQPTGDLRPCYVSVEAEGRFALVAHHTGGSVSILPINDRGGLEPVSDSVVREGSGPDPDRQSKSRPHAILTGPDNRVVYVPDLGADRIWLYELDYDLGQLNPTDDDHVRLQDGAGPRHLEFHSNGVYAYLINELDGTLTALERDPSTGSLELVDTESTLPESYAGHNQTADVHVHPSGQWVYGSNRGHNSIAAFAIDPDSGGLDPMGQVSTRGKWPRNFAIDPTGSYLFAENQKSNDIYAFTIDPDSGALTPTGDGIEVARPVCMLIVPFE